ncbi:MAG TPA: DMT family transporter [Anaerovoracaceae bacterium]|nr:DMT family transporter [Anaerovoracaceae bacterium]
MENKKILYLQVLFIGIFWGTSFVVIKIALSYITPYDYLSVRWTIAAVLALILVMAKKLKVNYRGKPNKYLVILALIQPGMFSLFESLGVQKTSASETSIILALVPIMTAFIVSIILREKVKAKTVGAAVICFVGVILTVVFEPHFQINGDLTGYFFLFTCVILAGTFAVLSNKMAAAYTATEVVVAMTVIGALCFNLLSLVRGSLVDGYMAVFTDWKPFVALLYLAIFCSIICFILYNRVNSRLNPAQTSLFISNSVTIIGVISGVLIAGDSMSIYKAFGVGLIVFGVVKHGLEEMKEGKKIEQKEFL